MEPANRRPAPGAGSARLPTNLSITGEPASVGRRQPVPSVGGAIYTAVLARPDTPSQQNGPLKPTAMDSDRSESCVSYKTTNRLISSDMLGPLSGMLDGTSPNVQMANAYIPAGVS